MTGAHDTRLTSGGACPAESETAAVSRTDLTSSAASALSRNRIIGDKPTFYRGWRAGLLSIAVIAGVVAGTVWVWNVRQSRKENLRRSVPSVDLSNLEREVAEIVNQGRAALVAAPASGRAWGEYANVLLAQEFTTEAAFCYARAEELDGREVRWPYLQGLCLALEEPERALACFQRAVRLREDLIDARLHSAELLIGVGQLAEAESHLSRAAVLEAENPRVLLGLGRLAFLNGRLDEAMRWAIRAAAAAPGLRDPHVLLCEIQQERGDGEAVAKQLQILQAIPESEPKSQWNEPFVNELARYKRDTRWRLAVADELVSHGRSSEAIDLLKRTEGYRTGDVRVLAMLAEAQLHQGQLQAAAASLDVALKTDPTYALVHFELGNLALIKSEWKTAAERYEEAVRLQSSLGSAHYNLAVCRQKLGDQEGAISAFEQACHCMPQDAQGRVALAGLLFEVGRREAGLEYLRKAASLAPNDPLIKSLVERAQSNRP